MKIILQNVMKSFGDFYAIKDLNLEIGQGVFGLLGPNGAGKTTLMKMLVGLLPVTSGQILVNGIPLNSKENIGQVRKSINYLPQEFGLYPTLHVIEVLDYFACLWGYKDKKARKEISDRLLGVVGLFEKRDSRVSSLSGGMRQRLGIAITLLNDPQILIVDEPTAGLDPEERIRFRNFLSVLASERTIILSTHIVGDIESICNRLAIMKKGSLIYNGEVRDLLNRTHGLVWQGTVTMDDYLNISSNYKITSNVVEGDKYHLRILSARRPGDVFSEAEPNLEEAYLKVIDEEGI